MTISKVFKSRIPSCKFAFRDGTTADFMQGKFSTSDTTKIEALMKEIQVVGEQASMHPTFYVDEKELEIDSEALTPLEIIKQQAYAKALEDLKASGLLRIDAGVSDQGNVALSFNNSAKISEAASESTGDASISGALGAKLANIGKNK